MKDILIGLAVFAIIFGGALFGMLLGKILPDQHVRDETRDAVRIVMAMLATLSAVVLGLLTGSSISSLAEKEGELRSAGVQFIMLDRTLAEYGPETGQTPDPTEATACRKNESDLAGGRRCGVALAHSAAGPVSTWFSRICSPCRRGRSNSAGSTSNALQIDQRDRRVALDDRRADRQPVPVAVLHCRRGLASGHLRQFRALLPSQCQRDRGLARCRACNRRPDLHDA